MGKLTRMAVTVMGCCLFVTMAGCAADTSKRDVAGPYQTWDDVIKRWIGGKTPDLYIELGPPNLHPHELEDGRTEMVWDFGIDRMPGQADYYDILPLYGGNLNCQLHFIADKEGIIQEGHRVGCE
ncbi:hypothetical protein W02_16940 [Nitrospira sp. KM1]|uniref:hypothetical protein n=1 Tax=Nitrospira sp. KM1 TaxID=1936990 RepID=UPI0013A7900D|nr:hypothetical protein [Nitrospira sp. KM1]BCA54554.1 hypothetical protein W02_16940 [Nitrospira sp. KM1]